MDDFTAKSVASRMMGGRQITSLDNISKSAISELGNMIMGNAASLLYKNGTTVDITPPRLYTGENMSFFTRDVQTVCLPFTLAADGLIEADISIA